MGKQYIYKLRGIPEMSEEKYHYFLGLQDGQKQLLDIVDSCDTSDQMETVFRYLDARIKLATFYYERWGDAVLQHMQAKDFGLDYKDACELKDKWEVEINLLSQVRNLMIEVCGVDRYGVWIKENHDERE